MKNTAARKLKQVPKGYLIVGVDPHKKKHAAVAKEQGVAVLLEADSSQFSFDF
jgi:ribosomal protein L2